MSALNPSTALARVVVDELVRNGVRDAVLAPGSRSAPLAYALHDADRAGRLRLHVRVDERSAGFVALGLAKASRLPVPVVTTSGTAAANLHPAVLEASESGVALVVLTADRPPELRATGANQTVDQVHLYGRAVREFHDVGVPERRPGQNAYWRALVCRALAAATGVLTDDPGPVHLNVGLREPLVPDGEDQGQTADQWPEPLDGRPGGAPWTAVSPRPTERRSDPWPARTLVVVGDAPPALGAATRLLAEEHGWPLVGEASGNVREGLAALRCGHLLLGDERFLAAHPPDRVLVVGRPTLHRSVAALLRSPDVDIHVVSPTARWADAGRAARSVAGSLPAGSGHHEPLDGAWAMSWVDADREVSRAVDTVLDSVPAAEGAVARDLFAALPPGSLLVAGSSQPARDLCLAAPRTGVTVLANRGGAGIDGTVSTALGAALAWQRDGGGRAFALVGDLTLLHDSNGFVVGPDEPRPDLTVVVVNNDGGGIFGLLEPGQPHLADAFERVFGTPHGVDLAALCGATATPHVRVSTAAEVVAAALDPRPGLQVVEVRTDRAGARALAARMRDAVAGALGPFA